MSMQTPAIQQFVEKVMAIDVGYAGIGGASSGIVGGLSANGDIANELHINVIAFATEYAKRTVDTASLEQLSQQLQGSFLTLRMVNIISDETLEALSNELSVLEKDAQKS